MPPAEVVGGINPLGLSKFLMLSEMQRGLAMEFGPPTISCMKKVTVDIVA
jgi:hypothetical protein